MKRIVLHGGTTIFLKGNIQDSDNGLVVSNVFNNIYYCNISEMYDGIMYK